MDAGCKIAVHIKANVSTLILMFSSHRGYRKKKMILFEAKHPRPQSDCVGDKDVFEMTAFRNLTHDLVQRATVLLSCLNLSLPQCGL